MRIIIRPKGKFGFSIILPIRLIINRFTLRLFQKKLEEMHISPEQCYALVKAIKKARRYHGHLEIIHVEFHTGKVVQVYL